MNRKGFTLVEMLASLSVLSLILGIAFYMVKGTLSLPVEELSKISDNEIYETARVYVIENNLSWNRDNNEYVCIRVSELADSGYFDYEEIVNIKDNIVRVERDYQTKVIKDIKFVDNCYS